MKTKRHNHLSVVELQAFGPKGDHVTTMETVCTGEAAVKTLLDSFICGVTRVLRLFTITSFSTLSSIHGKLNQTNGDQ